MRFKALRHQPSDAARKSGYDNEGQLPDTLPDSRSRPEAAGQHIFLATCSKLWSQAVGSEPECLPMPKLIMLVSRSQATALASQNGRSSVM